MRGRCGTLPLEGVRQQKQLDDVLAVRLDKVYTQLAVEGTVLRERFEGKALRQLDLGAYLRKHVGDHLLPWQQRTIIDRPLSPDERQQQMTVARQMLPPGVGISAEDARFSDRTSERINDRDPKDLKAALPHIEWAAFHGPRLVTDAIVDSQRLVLLGEPGSGKSTALRYLALTLASAALSEQRDLPRQLAGWEPLPDDGKLLPVFVPLLPFARLLAQDAGKAGAAAELWSFLADQLEPGNVRTGLAEAVHAELSAGRVLLMLDGLDEVAGEDSRRKVVRAVRAFAEEHPQCRMVVSCRVRAYEGEQNRAWQLPGWPTATLGEWNGAQIQHFIAAWYQAAVEVGGLAAAQLESRVSALQRAVAASQDLQRLAARPLLLTIMALVHLNDGRLPEDRVTLYSRCIDILLGQWELRGKDDSEYKSLMQYIGLPDRDVQRLRPLLTKAAFEAHRASPKDSPGSLGRETLRAMVADYLVQLDHTDPWRGAQKFLEYTDHRAGLLQASSASDAYVFPHLTFQEYLAGLELTSGVGVVARVMEHRADDRWRVPIFLGIGDHVSGSKLELPYQLLNELRVAEGKTDEHHQRDLILAAEIAQDVGWDRLEKEGGAAFRQLRRDLATALAPVVEGGVLPAAERVRAGALLGWIGDLRRGVCTLPPAMVRIEGGSFIIGNTEDEYQQIIAAEKKNELEDQAKSWYSDTRNDQAVMLNRFEIARYPVTNAQYALFIADDGYNPKRDWWDAAGRAWLRRNDQHEKNLRSWERREQKNEPEFWQNQQFGQAHPNYPVVGVSWYEAMTFCRWLTQHRVYNPQHHVFRLPTEAEWEYAARGTARRMYPWGPKTPDEEHANFNEIYGGTTAVGSFVHGATPQRVLDMAGNVYEWTGSIYAAYPYDASDGREDTSNPADKPFTLRGGGWSDRPIFLRASDRSRSSPVLHSFNVGFRLVRHLSGVK